MFRINIFKLAVSYWLLEVMLDFGQNLVSFTFCYLHFLYFWYSTAQQRLEQSYCLFFSSHLFFLSSEALVSDWCWRMLFCPLSVSSHFLSLTFPLKRSTLSYSQIFCIRPELSISQDSSDKRLETRGVRGTQTVIMTLRFSAAGTEMLSRYLTLSQAQLLITQTVSHLQ